MTESVDFDRGYLAALTNFDAYLRYCAIGRQQLDPGTVQHIREALAGMTQSAEEQVAAHGSLAATTKAIEGANS